MKFKNREDGGKQLGEFLLKRHFEKPIVIGLPRGGVVTAFEVAVVLKCPLEIVMVRKIGSPDDPEYGIGAMSEDEECFFSPQSSVYDLESDAVQSVIEEERVELRRRIKAYRGQALDIASGQTIILVDDGLATGVTATAALKFLKKFKPNKIIFAAPVGPSRVHGYLNDLCDEIILLNRPNPFGSVGGWYEEFEQTTDAEVKAILNRQKRGDAI